MRAYFHEKIISLSFLGVGMLVALYAFIYTFHPFSADANDLAINSMIILGAGGAALLATLNWFQLRDDEGPRFIWAYLSLALWTWTLGEVAWAFYAILGDSVPGVSIADFFYVVAYCFFGAAFVRQYRLVFAPPRHKILFWVALASTAILLTSGLMAVLMRQYWHGSQANLSETFISLFYPTGDLVLALASLQLARTFGRGQWGRIWLALLLFVFADAAYAVLVFTGLYAYAIDSGNIFTLFADGIYFLAYLVMAVACLSQLLLMLHGPPRSSSESYSDLIEV